MKLYAIRHSDVEYPLDKEGRRLVYGPTAVLTPLGEKQAHDLGEKFKQEGILLQALYTSPYKRAQQTTGILAEELVISNIVVIDGLKDIFPNSGEGKPFDDIIAIGGNIYAHPLEPEQETLDHLVKRVSTTIKDILAKGKEKNYEAIGVVSHGDLLSAMDWSLKHSLPAFIANEIYDEMRNAFYLQKGQACEYIIDNDLRLSGEGRIITTDTAQQSIEGFRKSPEKK